MAIKKTFGITLLVSLLSLCSCGGSSTTVVDGPIDTDLPIDERNLNAKDYAFSNLCGVDALGREIKRIDKAKEGTRYVGLFYSMWLGQHPESQTGIYNVTTLESTPEGLEALNSLVSNEKSRMDEFHFWGEPLYGYYNTKDPWVLKKHIELFTNAGVDYLCIDSTNRIIYTEAITTLLNILLDYSHQGFKVPKVMFYTNSNSGLTVSDLYNKFYQTEKYDDVWFSPNGKPMIIGITEDNNNASDQTKYNPSFSDYINPKFEEIFDIKESEWPNGDFNRDSIPWMSWQYPQNIHKGSIAVPVAQHSHSRISVSYKDPESHRGYNNLTGQVEGDADSGLSFQQMWNTALDESNHVTNVLCTSYNEWMAIKSLCDGGTNYQLVDVCDYEYSRDMEPMKGGYNDNYLLQLIENIRAYKYEDFVKYNKDEIMIDITDPSMDMWSIVSSQYEELTDEVQERNFVGAVSSLRYEDHTARNDIGVAKVAHDSENLYFYIETKDNLTKRDDMDKNYMNVFLKTKETDKNFMGFNYVINRSAKNGKASVEKCKGNYYWDKVGEADIVIKDNIMQLAIPRSLLEANSTCDIEFKIADNVNEPQDVMSYYVYGDAMPVGRLHYGY